MFGGGFEFERGVEDFVDGEIVLICALQSGTGAELSPVAAFVEEEVLAEFVEEMGGTGPLASGRETAVGEDTLAEGVDGANVHLREIVGMVGEVGDVAKEVLEALAELQSGFFGEGGEVDAVRRDVVEDDEVEGAPEEDASFARAWASGEVERAVDVEDGTALVGIGNKAFLLPKVFDGKGWHNPTLCSLIC